MEFNIEKFRALLRLAIGDRKQHEFADASGISKSRITHMLNDKEIGKPTKSTLLKIAGASNGKVTDEQLFSVCGYETTVSTANTASSSDSSVEDNYDIAKRLIEGVSYFTGTATKYKDVEEALDSVITLYGERNIHACVNEYLDYTGKGRKGAEKYVHCSFVWMSKTYAFTMPFVLFFCETAKGGVILSDCAFDLNTLMEMKNPKAGEFIMERVENGDIDCSEYSFIMLAKKREIYERALLRAIFSDLDDEEDDE